MKLLIGWRTMILWLWLVSIRHLGCSLQTILEMHFQFAARFWVQSLHLAEVPGHFLGTLTESSSVLADYCAVCCSCHDKLLTLDIFQMFNCHLQDVSFLQLGILRSLK